MPFSSRPLIVSQQGVTAAQPSKFFPVHCFLLFLLLLLTNCSGASASSAPQKANRDPIDPKPKQATQAVGSAPADTAILTAKNNNLRTGQNSYETLLNVNDVNVAHFGKRISYPVDGEVYAQPLFMPGLTIRGRKHNVVFVATEHDSVFAFDADQPGPALWQTSFIQPEQGITPFAPADVGGCDNLGPEIGITGTPVLDETTATLYVVSSTKEQGRFVQRLHALDLATGQEKNNSPVSIQATAQGVGDGSSGGIISFDPLTENQRAALLLVNGVVLITWASYCDNGLYHGWILGYQASSLEQVVVYNDTPDGYQGGIWQSGGGMAADAKNNVYVVTGNGTYNLNNGGRDASDSVLKLSVQPQSLQIEDYFTPFNQECLGFPNDTDLGSGGLLLIPTINKLVSVGKEGRLYLIDQDDLGKYTSIDDPCENQERTDVDAVVQEFPPDTIAGGLYGSPVYWASTHGDYLYLCGAGDHLKAFLLKQNSFTLAMQTPERFSYPGANSALSSNGGRAGSGILWVLDPQSVLRAYDASNLQRELYASDENPARDAMTSYVKFSVPTIANGEVFVGTQNSLLIYGLLQRPSQ